MGPLEKCTAELQGFIYLIWNIGINEVRICLLLHSYEKYYANFSTVLVQKT